MRYTPIPERSSRGINFNTYESTVREVNKLKNLKFDPCVFYVLEDPSGTFVSIRPIEAGAAEEKKWAFECYAVNNAGSVSTIEIEAGHFTVQGDSDYEVPAATYDLPDANSASNAYSTVVFDIASKYVEVQILETYPVPTASQVLVPLCEYSSNATTGVWTEEIIYHRGNINFSTSIVFG